MKTQRSFILVLAGATIAALASGCAHSAQKEDKIIQQPVSSKPAPDAGASIETKQVAAQQNAAWVTEINFNRGKAELSKESKARLTKIWTQATAKGAVDVVQVLAWADKEYPSEKQKSLSDSDRKLADARSSVIREFFQSFSNERGFEIKTVSMAERPSGLSETLGLSDAGIKKMFEEAGISTTNGKGEASATKASKAVVMISIRG